MPVIGLDVSKYEVKYYVDVNGKITSIVDFWSPDKSIEPIDFAIQRTSYGGKQDEMVDFLYPEVKKVRIRGAYHYFSSGVTWQTQLATILKAIQGKEYHFFAIDYEKLFNNLNATTFAEMMELIKQLKLKTGRRVLCYFNQEVYQSFMKPYNADAVINKMDIWYAQYPFFASLNLAKLPKMPAGITKKPDFWQYGGGDVANTAGYQAGLDYGSWRKGIDLNLWTGTYDELLEFAGLTDDTPLPIPVTEVERVKMSLVRPGVETEFTVSILSDGSVQLVDPDGD